MGSALSPIPYAARVLHSSPFNKQPKSGGNIPVRTDGPVPGNQPDPALQRFLDDGPDAQIPLSRLHLQRLVHYRVKVTSDFADSLLRRDVRVSHAGHDDRQASMPSRSQRW